MNTLTLPLSHNYDFAQVVASHGWVALAPHTYAADSRSMGYTFQLDDGTVWHIDISIDGENALRIDADGGAIELTDARRADLLAKVRWMLRFDDDLSVFYEMCGAQPVLAHVVARRSGRILRSATLWEDLVRVIATTNTTWTLTKRMIGRLVEGWGIPHPANAEWKAFPGPAVVAALEPADLQSIGWGYRAPYVIENARRLCSGEISLEALAAGSALSDKEVRKALVGLRGVGDYAAGTLMILLGRYSNVPVDTVARAAVSKAFYGGEPVTDKQVKAALEPYQPFAALALYCLSMAD